MSRISKSCPFFDILHYKVCVRNEGDCCLSAPVLLSRQADRKGEAEGRLLSPNYMNLVDMAYIIRWRA